MRVTEVAKREQVMGNIQRNSAKLQELQMQMASGQRINRPSDDPMGAVKMQDIVTKLSTNEQLRGNLAENVSFLERSELELGQMLEILGKVRTLTLSQSGSDSNDESRLMTARELSALRKGLLDAGNAREGKLYVFSGVKSLTPPLKKNLPHQPAKVETTGILQQDIRELLDVSQFRAQFDGHSSNDYRIRITKTGLFGQARCQLSDDGGKTWTEDEVLRPAVHMFNPKGRPDDRVFLRFSDEEGRLGNQSAGYFDIDLDRVIDFDVEEMDQLLGSEAQGIVFPEGMEFIFAKNPEVDYVGSPEKKEIMIATGVTSLLGVTAEEALLGKGEGEVDAFSLIASLERAMLENDGTAIAKRLGELELAEKQILKRLADTGNLVRELQTAEMKLEDQTFEHEKRLSEIRDVDLAKTSLEVNTAEVNNRLALDTGSRLIQPTLADFLR
mgnify:FL=1